MFRKFCFLILLTGVCSQEEQNDNRNSTGELILKKLVKTTVEFVHFYEQLYH